MSPRTPDTPSTATLVRHLTDDVATRHLAGHGVASGLGLWLLLALLAPAADDPAELEAALGTDAADAAARAAELLAQPHPAVSAAVALWTREELLDPATAGDWSSGLPATVTRGPVPSQADADRWADEHTKGLIPRFPVQVDPLTAFILASALAAKVSWAEPFDDAPLDELDGPFAATASAVLRAPASHRRLLVQTEAAGLVGVHAAASTDGLLVASVVADEATPTTEVHRAALDVAALLAGEPTTAAEVDLFDLPLGPGPAWEVTERTYEGTGPAGPRQLVHALLVPWRAESTHDLRATAGVQAAFAVLERFLRPELRPADLTAVQAAVAAYSKEGFEAAALTAISMRAGAMPQQNLITLREATIRFDRPHAVIAVALDSAPDPERGYGTRELGAPAWAGLPVFNAWVAEPG